MPLFLVVLVVKPIPLMRRSLWVAFRRVLPLLLSAERGDVEQAPDVAEGLDRATGGEVGMEDIFVIVDKHVESEPLCDPEVLGNVVMRGEPGEVPTHPRLESLDVRLWRGRDQHQRCIAGVQVREVGEAVDEHGASATSTLGEIGNSWLEEKTIDDELSAAIEEIEQADLAVRSLELVRLVDPHHRQPAALGGKLGADAGRLLCPAEEIVAGSLPLGS